jgi:hypothetical protein
MQRIETGTTGERRIRAALFVIMFAAFGIWFAYDGWVKYPKQNLEWAVQSLPERPSEMPVINPKVSRQTVITIEQQCRNDQKTFTESDLEERLGEPAYVDPDTGTRYYIGPAILCKVRLNDGVLRYEDLAQWDKAFKADESRQHSEADIKNQRLFSIILAFVVLFGLIHLVRVLRTRVVVDDEGLLYNGTRITWDQMQALDIAVYRHKGWVDLEYARNGGSAKLRLDNYKIGAFRDVVTAIVERKAFLSPFTPAAEDETVEDQARDPE